MPSANHDTLVRRLALILIKLNQGQKLDPKLLAEEFNVNMRTIQRDINERFSYLPLEKSQGQHHLNPAFLGKLTVKDIERFAALAGVNGLFPALSENFLRELFDTRIQSALLVKGHNYGRWVGSGKARHGILSRDFQVWAWRTARNAPQCPAGADASQLEAAIDATPQQCSGLALQQGGMAMAASRVAARQVTLQQRRLIRELDRHHATRNGRSTDFLERHYSLTAAPRHCRYRLFVAKYPVSSQQSECGYRNQSWK